VFSSEYLLFWENKIGLSINDLSYQKSLHHWINDGLMALFFLLIGLEIKREIISGELSTYQKAILPILAAFAGMVFPAILFLSVNISEPTVSGWGIPTATDIAFSLTVLSLIKGVPKSLRIFLIALAVADDIGAIILIGVFYSANINIFYCFASAIILSILLLMNRKGINKLSYYLILGLLLWQMIINSGIHPTIAGVILAFTIPYDKDSHTSPLHRLEEVLNKPVSFFILPLFALSNTGIILGSDFLHGLTTPDSIGIFLGLCIGKPLGIITVVYLSIKFKLAKLPTNAKIMDIIGLGFVCGIGYTMSIFISTVAYSNQVYIDSSKITVLIASVISALAGLFILIISRKISLNPGMEYD
jgi:NhaA family Na+:H+ antiporter